MLTTDAQSGSSNGARMSRRYYTAFGERVAELGEGGQPPPAWAATTFGYCGAWGYQGSAEWPTESNFGGSSGGGSGGSPSSDDFWESDLGVLHVGARWYWPETGRFLQRDPIGIAGGTNTYSYTAADPAERIDPDGTMDWSWRGFGGAALGGAATGATQGARTGGLAGAFTGACWGLVGGANAYNAIYDWHAFWDTIDAQNEARERNDEAIEIYNRLTERINGQIEELRRERAWRDHGRQEFIDGLINGPSPGLRDIAQQALSDR
ncbi:MAG: RHS repeat-associated core domain-containing protein [Phycisphaerae bacterium]